ncbi:MAG: hypothetical protein OXI91_03640 [Chloroflexota bacterium]|nr:hypothetical protein [Chloroflexota bacterium]
MDLKNLTKIKPPPFPPALAPARRLLGAAILVAALALVGITVNEYRLLHAVADIPTASRHSQAASALDCPRLCPSAETTPGTAAAPATQTPDFLDLRGFRHTIPFTPD